MRYSRSDEDRERCERRRRTPLWKCRGKEDIRKVDDGERAESEGMFWIRNVRDQVCADTVSLACVHQTRDQQVTAKKIVLQR